MTLFEPRAILTKITCYFILALSDGLLQERLQKGNVNLRKVFILWSGGRLSLLGFISSITSATLEHNLENNRVNKQKKTIRFYRDVTSNQLISFLVNDQREAKFFSTYLFLFLTLYMFRAHRAHHQERQILSIQPLGAVGGRAVCRSSDLHTARPPTQSDSCQRLYWQFFSPDDEYDVLETCRELKTKINE